MLVLVLRTRPPRVAPPPLPPNVLRTLSLSGPAGPGRMGRASGGRAAYVSAVGRAGAAHARLPRFGGPSWKGRRGQTCH